MSIVGQEKGGSSRKGKLQHGNALGPDRLLFTAVTFSTRLSRGRLKNTALTMMNRYRTLQQLGDGTYGSVVLGQRVDTGEKVRGIRDEELR